MQVAKNGGGKVLMTIKDLLIVEIESTPDSLLAETLDFLRFLKVKHSQEPPTTSETQRGSTAQDLLEFAGSWSGDDIRECLQLARDSRLPLEL
ncbi:MAG: DUF2281 domain-containing protein [Cyanosarcina radialis HA8281-LM2]|jgi:hypothetical protein|nr:DUF2281 domain-containing protein [Cyanosarcina radialis HA8281-LM2]